MDERYTIRYNVIVIAEVLVFPLHAHRFGGVQAVALIVQEAVRFVAEMLGVSCAKDLESIVGLRNLLIHRY